MTGGLTAGDDTRADATRKPDQAKGKK